MNYKYFTPQSVLDKLTDYNYLITNPSFKQQKIMTTKKSISTESLNEFLLKEIEITKQELEQKKQENENLELKVMEYLMDKYASRFEVPGDSKANDLILVCVTPKELGILKSGLVAQKKLMRGKIRNNERHAVAGDRPAWTDKDFETAIKKRKLQLADADMLKTRLENL